MLPPIPLGWRYLLKEETPKSYYRALDAFLEKELAGGQTILPARKDIFNALASTSYDQVRVLLVGQDPYPTPGHAHGLCFSVQLTVRPLPLSLRNVYRELHDDVGCQISNNGCLEPWARQGILMLNTVLTVQAHKANSHQGRGWIQKNGVRNYSPSRGGVRRRRILSGVVGVAMADEYFTVPIRLWLLVA